MKHATVDALMQIEALLDQIRERDGLREKKYGIFYRKSRSFLHFHEDPTGLFADLRNPKGDFDRFRVSQASEQTVFLTALDRVLAQL